MERVYLGIQILSSYLRHSPNVSLICNKYTQTHKLAVMFHTNNSNKTFHSCQLCLYGCRLDLANSNSLNAAPQRVPTSYLQNAQILFLWVFLKNVMSLNKELFSPVAGLSSLARFYNLASLTGNPVSVVQDLQLLICLNQRPREQKATSKSEICCSDHYISYLTC